MKVQNNVVNVIDGDEFTSVKSKVNKNKLAKLYGILSNIYKDPISSIVREYISNAFDANVEAYNVKELNYEDCAKKYPWILGEPIPELALSEEEFLELKNKLTRAGKDEPIISGVDNSENQTYFYVKDFGIGLSPERMEHIYFNYLDSTKEDNNDEIGGLTCRFI